MMRQLCISSWLAVFRSSLQGEEEARSGGSSQEVYLEEEIVLYVASRCQ